MLKILERKTFFFLISIGALVVFLILAWLYGQKQEFAYVIIAALLLLVWMVYVLWYACMRWLHFIEVHVKQYREEKDLASGITAWLSLFLYLILVPGVWLLAMGEGAPDIAQKGYPIYVQTIATITPAILGLLGVQYTIAMQDKNRKEDTRLAKKPFFTIEYKVGGSTQIEDNAPHAFCLHFIMKNVSDNIAIPIGIGGGETNELSFWFDYSPVPSAGTVKAVAEIDNKVPFTSNTYTIKFYYKDVLDNYYCCCICILLSNVSKYETPIVCSELLCSSETVEWLKKTAFSKSSDYWKTYEITTY